MAQQAEGEPSTGSLGQVMYTRGRALRGSGGIRCQTKWVDRWAKMDLTNSLTECKFSPDHVDCTVWKQHEQDGSECVTDDYEWREHASKTLAHHWSGVHGADVLSVWWKGPVGQPIDQLRVRIKLRDC